MHVRNVGIRFLISGRILTCQILAPTFSRGPCNMRVLVLSCTIIPVLVKVTVHPALQNFPILIRLFVSAGMMCTSAVPMGSLGKSRAADAANCSNFTDAVPTILASALASIFVTGAEGVKKCPLAPVSAMAVSCRSVVIYELGDYR